MRTISLSLVLVLFMCSLSFGQTCSGTRSTPVRSTLRAIVEAKPVRTTATSILSKLSRPASSCSGNTATLSCAGSAQATGCAGSVQSSCAGGHVVSSVPAPVAPASACNCGCEQGLPCSCSPQKTAVACAACSLVESHQHVQQFATPIRTAMSSAYQQALASAQYRADNRIHGHSYLDTHRTSGVGWATSDSNPTTCLGRGGANYAVVRGADGWYATKFN